METSDKPRAGESTGKIRQCVHETLEAFFADMGDHTPDNVYQMVLKEVERPMLEVVLRKTRGNQTRAAEILGINRGTLRKKLREHGLD